MMQYMMDLNEYRSEISKNDIENLIEDDFISLDDYIFKIKWRWCTSEYYLFINHKVYHTFLTYWIILFLSSSKLVSLCSTRCLKFYIYAPIKIIAIFAYSSLFSMLILLEYLSLMVLLSSSRPLLSWLMRSISAPKIWILLA